MQEAFEKIINKLNERIDHHEKRRKLLMDAGLHVEADKITDRILELDFAKRAVEQESAEYNNGWIPCGEQQPEKSGTYNITAFDGGKYRTTNAMWKKRSESWNLKGQRAYWSVIAWQPLPAPYQPKGE